MDRCRSLLSSLPASSANAESGKGGEEVMERREEKEGGGVGTEGSCLADNSWSMSLAEDTPTSSTSDTGSEVTTEMGNVTFDLRSLSEDQLHSLEEVSVLLPAVRVWLDWVAGQEGFWLPFLSPQNRTDLYVTNTCTHTLTHSRTCARTRTHTHTHTHTHTTYSMYLCLQWSCSGGSDSTSGQMPPIIPYPCQ